jgi:hypothetical protein
MYTLILLAASTVLRDSDCYERSLLPAPELVRGYREGRLEVDVHLLDPRGGEEGRKSQELWDYRVRVMVANIARYDQAVREAAWYERERLPNCVFCQTAAEILEGRRYVRSIAEYTATRFNGVFPADFYPAPKRPPNKK